MCEELGVEFSPMSSGLDIGVGVQPYSFPAAVEPVFVVGEGAGASA